MFARDRLLAKKSMKDIVPGLNRDSERISRGMARRGLNRSWMCSNS